MSVHASLSILLLFLAFNAATAQEQHRHVSTTHELDLNQFASGETGKHRKMKLERGDVLFQQSDSSSLQWRDSTYPVTRFSIQTKKPFRLIAFESRIDDFDTSQFSLHVVVLQLHNGDTVFREFPIQPDAGTKGSKHWTRIKIEDTGLALQAAPFYLGYAYRPKPGVKEFRYHPYTVSAGGEGGWFSIRKGQWQLSRSPFYEILPFRISYTEL